MPGWNEYDIAHFPKLRGTIEGGRPSSDLSSIEITEAMVAAGEEFFNQWQSLTSPERLVKLVYLAMVLASPSYQDPETIDYGTF